MQPATVVCWALLGVDVGIRRRSTSYAISKCPVDEHSRGGHRGRDNFRAAGGIGRWYCFEVSAMESLEIAGN